MRRQQSIFASVARLTSRALGRRSLRLIPCDASGAMDVAALRVAIAADRDRNLLPFLVVGTAGTVDIGAIDDLTQMAQVCEEQQLWFHVDAAFGAIAMLSPVLRPLLTGIERADSVAFDFHKWAQVPYDAGCIVVRDPAAHQAAFAHEAAYLRRETRGLAAGRPWPVDLGPELSRGFRALKVWMTIKAYGTDRLGEVAARCCALARRLASAIDDEPLLERMAPVRLNIVCFRYRPGDDEFQAAIAADLQELGPGGPLDDNRHGPNGASRRVRQSPIKRRRCGRGDPSGTRRRCTAPVRGVTSGRRAFCHDDRFGEGLLTGI